MLHKKIKLILLPTILLVLLLTSIILLANNLIQMPSIQKYLTERLSLFTGIEIRTGMIELDLWRGIGISVSDFEASPDKKGNKIKASQMKITLDIKELMKGQIVPRSLYLLRPEVKLVVHEKPPSLERISAIILNDYVSLWIKEIQSVFIEKARVNFIERPFELELQSFNIHQKRQDSFKYTLSSGGYANYKGTKTPFRLRGTILSPSQKKETTSIDMILQTDGTPLDLIPLSKFVAIKKGSIKTDLHIFGDVDGDISIDGQAYLKPCHFSLLHSGRHKDIYLPELVIDFESSIKGKRFNAPSIKLESQGLLLGASVKLEMEDAGNPHIEITGNSDFMTIETFKKLFPTQLLPLWIEEELFPILIDGDIRLNLFKLKGRRDRIKNIQAPDNYSVLEMDLECDNFNISGKGIQLPFKEVSSAISLRQGNFQISNLKAEFGTSRINEACFVISDVYSKSPFFETSIDGSFNLEELISQKEMEFIPLDIRQQLDEIETLTGNLRCRTVITYEDGWDFLKILWGEFFFKGCLLDQERLLYPLFIKNAEVIVSEENPNRFISNGSWGNTTFRTAGDFSILGKKLSPQRADIFANIDMAEVIPIFQNTLSIPFTFRTAIPMQLSAVRETDFWSLLGRAGLNGIVFENDKFKIDPHGRDDYLFFDLEYRSGGMTELKESPVRIGNSTVFVSGFLDPNIKNVINLDLSSSHLSIEDIGFRVEQISTPIKGTIDSDLKIEIPLTDNNEFITTGQIKGENLFIDTEVFNSPIQECDFTLNISSNHIDIDSLNFMIGKSNLSITGNLKEWGSPKGDIFIKSTFLDTADIIPREYSDILEHKSGPMDNFINKLDLAIDLNITKGYWRELQWERLNADLNLLTGALFINRSNIDLEHGSLDIKGHILRGEKPDMAFNGIVILNEQPVEKLFKDIRFDYQDLKGDLTMAAKLYVHGKRKKDLIPSLTGSADITIQNGLIKKPNTFIKVLDALSLQNIIKERPTDLREEGLFFERIQAESQITRGVLRSENFIMRSPVFNAVAYGESNLEEKTVDFTLATQPHGTIDTLVSNIPIVGYIITGENRSVLAYTFEVKGNISDPTVTFIPIESVGKGVAGILKRLLTTPVRVMKTLQNESENNQGESSNQSGQGLFIPKP